MRNQTRIVLIALLVMASWIHAEDTTVKLIQNATTIDVQIGGKPFTTYYFADGRGIPYSRPFFYPVLAPDGVELTSDQLDVKGGDHPHHRSLWVAHGDVNGADHWSLAKDREKTPKQRHIAFSKVEGDTLVEELAWEGKTTEPILKEIRTWRFFVWPDGARGIDLTSVYSAIDAPVTLGDTKEAGLISVRMAKSISAKPTLSNSRGQSGEGMTAEKLLWGKPAEWCDESGELDGKPYGIAIIDHPQNPRYPTTWHVRAYGLMSANIFALHEYDKNNAKDAGKMVIEKDKPVTFKYRVVVHTGDAKSASLDEKMKEFK